MKALKENRDFRRLYGRGKSLVGRSVVLYYLPGRSRENRVGVTCGKKIGGAVTRNRAKRVLRAAYRQNEKALVAGKRFDLILVARSRTPQMKSTQVAVELERLLQKAGIIDKAADGKPKVGCE